MKCFIGYDAREDEAYRVCKHSLNKFGVGVTPMKHKELRDIGLFDRPWYTGTTGQMVDERDGRPFSTEFAHSRFLTTHFAKHLGIYDQWVLFCDCDFLFLSDPKALLEIADPSKAVMVVQHKHEPQEGLKMDGVSQARYARKNWSSLILWNLHHPANDLTADDVNHKTGLELHGFYWLQDDQIGALPPEWNYLVGHSDPSIKPKAVHYTDGGPWFPKYSDVPYALPWKQERFRMLADELRAA